MRSSSGSSRGASLVRAGAGAGAAGEAGRKKVVQPLNNKTVPCPNTTQRTPLKLTQLLHAACWFPLNLNPLRLLRIPTRRKPPRWRPRGCSIEARHPCRRRRLAQAATRAATRLGHIQLRPEGGAEAGRAPRVVDHTPLACEAWRWLSMQPALWRQR